jgi:hypothetical protein
MSSSFLLLGSKENCSANADSLSIKSSIDVFLGKNKIRLLENWRAFFNN